VTSKIRSPFGFANGSASESLPLRYIFTQSKLFYR